MKGEANDLKNNFTNINSNIFGLLSKKDQKLILKELKNLEKNNIDLSKLIEEGENKNTILISSVYFNLTEVSEYLIDYFRNIIKSTTKFLDYLNLRNIKGYDALLYSAYRGNYTIFQKLLDNGAYLNSTNITGLNVLHLAAQGNCLNIIASLTEKYIFNINSQDNNGNTALHWAVYFNNHQSIDYLLYYNIDINIKDNNNCTAMDIAINKENDLLVEKLKEGIITKCNMSGNIYSISKYFDKKELFKIFVRMHLYRLFIIIIIISEFFNQKLLFIGLQNIQINFIFIVLFISLCSSYYIIHKNEPGNKSKNKNTLFSLINQGNDLSNVCPWCVGFINANSYHCPYCKKCVSFQEFHNSMLNNCIAKYNFKNYLFYLFFITFVFTLKFFAGIYVLKNIEFSIIKDNKYTVIYNIMIDSIFCSLGIYRLVKKIELYNKSEKGTNRGMYTNENNNFFPEIDNKLSGLEL
jgi:ankyrin repeat protein